MIYFSELITKSALGVNGKNIGKVSDLIFLTSDVPHITKIEIKKEHGKRMVFPVSAVKKINNHVVIDTKEQAILAENEAYIGINLLNQQIIDIKGKNIVRVNDVVIQDKPTLIISGIDISLGAVLRWFFLEESLNKGLAIFNKNLSKKLLPWSEIQPLELVKGKVVLSKSEEKLKAINPEDLADYLEKTTIHNAVKILSLMNDKAASEVIQSLHISFQTQIFRMLPVEDAATILTFSDPDEATDLLFLVNKQKRELLLQTLPEDKKKELLFLMKHSETSIGELMTTDFFTVSAESTVKTVLEHVRKNTKDFSQMQYAYVVNNNTELVGVLSLHELLIQPDEAQILKFMTQNVVVAHLTTSKKIALKRMMKYKLYAIPVIGNSRNILGLVTLDDLVESIGEIISQ